MMHVKNVWLIHTSTNSEAILISTQKLKLFEAKTQSHWCFPKSLQRCGVQTIELCRIFCLNQPLRQDKKALKLATAGECS